MRLRLLLVGMSLVAAACGSAVTTSPPAASNAAPSPTLPGSPPAASSAAQSPTLPALPAPATVAPPSPTPPGPSATGSDAPETPGESAQASDEPLPGEGATHIAPELEALLPATVNSIVLSRQSTTGDQVLADDASSNSIRAFLASVGKTPKDFRLARAVDDSGQLDLVVFAFRVPGVGAEALAQALQKSALVDNPMLITASATVGGRKVLTTADPDLGVGSYLYQHDGVVFDIETQDPGIAAQVISRLP